MDAKLRKDGELVKAKEEHFTRQVPRNSACVMHRFGGLHPRTVVPSGLQLCRSVGKIWALRISAEDARTHFPAGRFIASSGAEMSVAPGDFLAMPFPAGLELSVVPRHGLRPKVLRCGNRERSGQQRRRANTSASALCVADHLEDVSVNYIGRQLESER